MKAKGELQRLVLNRQWGVVTATECSSGRQSACVLDSRCCTCGHVHYTLHGSNANTQHAETHCVLSGSKYVHRLRSESIQLKWQVPASPDQCRGAPLDVQGSACRQHRPHICQHRYEHLSQHLRLWFKFIILHFHKLVLPNFAVKKTSKLLCYSSFFVT